MQIVFTRYAGDACALVLYERYQEALEKRFSKAYLAVVEEVRDHLDNAPAKAVFDRFQAEYREVSEGGVLRTLFEMAEADKIGMKVDEDRIPIHQETIEIMELFDGNPYASLSDGCMVAFTDRGPELVEALRDAGIPAEIIGETEKGRKKVLLRGGEPQCMNRPKKDLLKEMR